MYTLYKISYGFIYESWLSFVPSAPGSAPRIFPQFVDKEEHPDRGGLFTFGLARFWPPSEPSEARRLTPAYCNEAWLQVKIQSTWPSQFDFTSREAKDLILQVEKRRQGRT